MDCSPPGSSVHGILQARILGWVVIPFSRGSSRPRDQTRVSCIARRLFTFWPPGKPQPGIKSTSPSLQDEFLTTGPPGNSLQYFFLTAPPLSLHCRPSLIRNCSKELPHPGFCLVSQPGLAIIWRNSAYPNHLSYPRPAVYWGFYREVVGVLESPRIFTHSAPPHLGSKGFQAAGRDSATSGSSCFSWCPKGHCLGVPATETRAWNRDGDTWKSHQDFNSVWSVCGQQIFIGLGTVLGLGNCRSDEPLPCPSAVHSLVVGENEQTLSTGC